MGEWRDVLIPGVLLPLPCRQECVAFTCQWHVEQSDALRSGGASPLASSSLLRTSGGLRHPGKQLAPRAQTLSLPCVHSPLPDPFTASPPLPSLGGVRTPPTKQRTTITAMATAGPLQAVLHRPPAGRPGVRQMDRTHPGRPQQAHAPRGRTALSGGRVGRSHGRGGGGGVDRWRR